MRGRLVPIFDLDGTLLDSDAALTAPFVVLGVPEERVPFGLSLDEACARVGITVEDYLAAYDGSLASPFPGVAEMLDALPRWAVCSNKLGDHARREIERLGWEPEVGLFAEDFGGPKRVAPVLEALRVGPSDAVFVGDSDYDRACARDAGVEFALAGWNPRASSVGDEIVLERPADLLSLIDARRIQS